MQARQWPATTVLVGLVVLGAAGVVAVASCEPDSAGGGDTAAVAGAAAGTGSGLEELTAEQILDRARQAGAGLTSLRGTVRMPEKSGTLEYSLSVGRSGDCTGTVSEGGVEAEVRRQGGTVWVKPSDAMLRLMLPDAGPELADKWLTGAADLDRFSGYCDRLFGLATADGPLKPAAATGWTKSGVRQVGGTRAVFLGFRTADGGPDSQVGTVAIADEGQPRLLSVDESGDGAVAMRFDAFDEPVAVTPPPAGLIVDASGYRFATDGSR
ncbi:hypothetical protein ACIQF6_04970 [Kitasatospora sp. NPDC092948]|uniref:hypothetical protein n=1 Tax=Kitasatospora sp. NPDC092948 TaxID=3364088 RepID=UPI0038176640